MKTNGRYKYLGGGNNYVEVYSPDNPPPQQPSKVYTHYISINIKNALYGNPIGGALLTLVSSQRIWSVADERNETIVMQKAIDFINSHNDATTGVQQVAGIYGLDDVTKLKIISQIAFRSVEKCDVMVLDSSWYANDKYYTPQLFRVIEA